MNNKLKRETFLSSKKAVSMIEYGILGSLIAAAGLIAVTSAGTSIRDIFSDTSMTVDQAGYLSQTGQGSNLLPVAGDNFDIILGSMSSFPIINPGSSFSFDFSTLVALTDPGTVNTGDLIWSVGTSADPLPLGLSLDTASGVVSGTPDASLANTSSTFQIIASFAGESGDQLYTLNIGGVIITVSQISAGRYFTCALTVNNAVYCWGANNVGQLGNGSTVDSAVPTQVVGLGSGVSSIKTGDSHSCAIMNTGELRCWGWCDSGRLGNGGTSNSTTPVSVIGFSNNTAQVSVGTTHTCALTTSGSVYCWGVNNVGELGNGGLTGTATSPVPVTGLNENVSYIASGSRHSCAVMTSGEIRCWGMGSLGRIGDGGTDNRFSPSTVVGISNGVQVTAGFDHTCARLDDNSARCWGNGMNGELGDGNGGGGFSTPYSATTPQNVLNLSGGITSISAGGGHTCAVTTTNTAKCWGSNWAGQLGNGNEFNQNTPQEVFGLQNTTSFISAGDSHTCAVTTSGEGKCWGYGEYGEIGTGMTGWTYSPNTPQDIVW